MCQRGPRPGRLRGVDIAFDQLYNHYVHNSDGGMREPAVHSAPWLSASGMHVPCARRATDCNCLYRALSLCWYVQYTVFWVSVYADSSKWHLKVVQSSEKWTFERASICAFLTWHEIDGAFSRTTVELFWQTKTITLCMNSTLFLILLANIAIILHTFT